MADLKTDYKDDILDTSQNTRRKYQMINNQDGTVSFVDVTEYIQQGDSFGADDVNAITDAINKNDGVPVGAVVTFDGSQLPSGFEPYTTAEQSAIAQINDNLALKQPLSAILTMLTNSNIKTYEIQLNSVINTIAKLQKYISMRNFEIGTEVSSFKLSNSSQFFGLMVSNSPSPTLTSGLFFGYDYDDVAFFSKNNGSVTIYHLNKTKKYPAS